MTSALTYRTGMTIHLHDGAEREFDLVLQCSVTPGSPEVGRTYMGDPDKYDPGGPDEVWIDSLRAFDERGKECATVAKLALLIARSDEELEQDIVETWNEHEASDAE